MVLGNISHVLGIPSIFFSKIFILKKNQIPHWVKIGFRYVINNMRCRKRRDRILIRQLLFAGILMKNIVKRSRARVRYCYSLSLIDTKDKMKEALIIK